jgi:hypothetical protein
MGNRLSIAPDRQPLAGTPKPRSARILQESRGGWTPLELFHRAVMLMQTLEPLMRQAIRVISGLTQFHDPLERPAFLHSGRCGRSALIDGSLI